jgi:hypothetical protein
MVCQLIKKLPTFMGSKGLLQCQEKLTAGPCPEPDKSSVETHIFFLKSAVVSAKRVFPF